MTENASHLMLPEEAIISKIFLVRGKKVMLDRDLAELYGVETKVLKQAVKRNIRRFPLDFMFELNDEEFNNLRSQIVTSSWGGVRYNPMVFTEQGVTMLSCILNSDRAIEVNILVIRVFSKMREMLLTHKEILLKLEQLEKKFTKHDNEIEIIFNTLKELIKPPVQERKKVGFKFPEKK